MVVLFFATSKHKNSNFSNKEYSDSIKKSVLSSDANKCIGIDLSVMKELQLPSLDHLLKISDDVGRIQHEVEGFLKVLEKKLQDLQPDCKLTVALKNKPHKIKEGILAFSWDDQKYPKNQKTIENVLEKILDKLNITKNNLKKKSDDYQQECENLKQKQKSDNEARMFMKKDYREILKNKLDTMVKSDYLTSLLVFVPVNNVQIFQSKYENLVKDCVVPHSGIQLCNNEDEKIRLFRVVLMNHLKDNYVNELRKVVKANSKEFDETEVTSLPTLLQEQKKIELNIEEKKVRHLFNKSFFSYFFYMLFN